jgi:intein/homing endonuclease
VFFRDFFENFCGCGANNKSFKNIILKFSKTQVISILGQYFKGDGHFPSDYDRVSNITSTSKKMIFDVSFILNSLGLLVMPCVNFHENAKHKNPNANIANWYDGYYLSSGSYSKAKLKNILYGETLNEKKSNKGKRYVEGEDCYAVKIKKISEVSYIDKVYNLQVADDETYCANLYSCHNCHYCNQEDSKYQRYMLMIQKETSIKEIEKKLSTEDRMDIFELQDQNLWMKSERELNEKWLEMYQDVIPYDLFIQAKRNTVEICRKANGVEIDRSLKLPQFPDANDRLKDAIIQGVKWRGCNGRKYLDRIKEEYELICRKGFASYFLIQKQMTDEARRICPELLGWGDGSEAVGPGRGCLSGDVEIIVDKGISKRLDNVKVGDRVITHTGEFKTVLEVLNYSVEEKLVKLYSFYGDNGGVTLTKDHLVLSEQCHKTNETKKWAESTKSSKCKIIEPTGNLEWVRADSLKVGDWIFVPFPETKINNVDCIDLADFCNSKELHNDENYVYQDWMNPLTGSIRKRKKLKRIITLDEEWHTVIGLFAGDGWLRSDESGRVGFCFHSEDNLDSLNLLEKKLSEIEAEYYLKKESDKKLIQVVVNNRFFYLMFKKLYDRYKCTPETKHVPDFVFTQKDEYRWAYLRGYLFSDGHHKYKHKLSFTTCSAELASQTRMVCWSLGVPCSLGRYDRIDKRSNKRSVGFTLVAPHKNQLSGMDAQKIYQYRKIDDGFLFRIRKIEESDDVNVVYDLTVEDNHNYLTTSFLVHNSAVGSLVCYCLGITDVDPIRHNLLFSRFLSESRGGKSIRLKFSSKKVSA